MSEPSRKSKSWLAVFAVVGPGILVAATGVGAGDLATATFSGAKLGTAILWAVLLGAGLKYVLNEGLTRWQLVTGTTLLEGAVKHLGATTLWIFLSYLIVWSFLVAMSLMSACGVAAHAILPIFADAASDKLLYGVLHSLIAVGLVLYGGYKLFERVMAVCIGLMFLVCVFTASFLCPPPLELLSSLLVPRIPNLHSGGLPWTIALLGGVGGTVTVLCYGYWIREEGREGVEHINACKIDLGVGYAMTAVFGLSMVIIGSQLPSIQGTGATLIVNVADILQERMGSLGVFTKWAFLIGAWGAVFSSLLGVWQSVPYLFTDFTRLLLSEQSGQPKPAKDLQSTELSNASDRSPVDIRDGGWVEKIDSTTTVYRAYLAALATIPIAGLYAMNFSTAMKVNGVVGALFIPMLALALIRLNGNRILVGEHRNTNLTTAILIFTLIIFIIAGGFQIVQTLSPSG